ncbi:pentatricopeptide repeat-containing protein At1g73400, mitochondrial [Cicer arietinum]|uniref:Pentatricopeptide repeat-containing protein At1g73400, mitochondrial n=1 Tax=Cicer arietinum TaxID=3827 RepID=A0A1S2Z542_CICAR|nr:pentatricopeptide repeat-containing protein At1g73400, mitochondrial [Cicer arietinum]
MLSIPKHKIMFTGRINRLIRSLINHSFSSLTHHHHHYHTYLLRNKALPQIETTFKSSMFFVFQYSSYCQLPLSDSHCVQLIQFPLPMNSFAALSVRHYCSETVSMNQDFGCGVSDDVVEGTNGFESDDVVAGTNGFESDIDKVHYTIMDNLLGFNKMEKALENLGIPLSTPLVIGVLHKLRYDEKIAFRFFTWAGHQDNYVHEPCAYNDMMDILSSTKYKVKQFRIVCDVLDYMKRNNKSTVPAEVLLNILRKYTEKYLTHVQKFAKKKRVRVKTQPEINAFNFLLDALCKCCLVEEAEGLYKRMRKMINPNGDTYNILVFGWCRVRNPTRGMKLLEEMIELGHKPDNFTYNTALDTYCKAGMITDAVELFEFMRTKGSIISSPTAKSYSIIIVALVQNNRMEECLKLMGHMISSGCLPDVTTYKDIIEGMCLCGKIDEAYKFLDEMGNKGYRPDIVTYNCFLKVLCDSKKSEEAIKLYGRMIEMSCTPSVQTYNMLILMFFKMDDPDGAFETWQEMEKRGCRPDTDTYCVMIEGLFNCNKAEDACILLEEVINKEIKLPYRKFDSLLMQLSGIGDLQAIHKLSDHMRKFYNNPMARRYALSQKRKSMSLRGKS